MKVLYGVLALALASLVGPLAPGWMPDLALAPFLALCLTDARPGPTVALGVALGVLSQALSPQTPWVLPGFYALWAWFSWFLLQHLSMGPGARAAVFLLGAVPQALIRSHGMALPANVVGTAVLAYALHYLWLRGQGGL